MGRFKLNSLPEEQRIQMVAEFYDCISLLKNRQEVREFFRDLLNADEIAMLMRRIEVASMLLAGFTYDEIWSTLRVGKSKIGNVQKKLLRQGGGYRLIVKRLVEARRSRFEKKERFRKQRETLSEFARAKRKYPAYFLLFNLIDSIGELLSEKISDRETALKTPSNLKRR